jgi:hypothetical protein
LADDPSGQAALSFDLLPEVFLLTPGSNGLHKVLAIGGNFRSGLRADMPAQRGAACLHVPLSAFTFGFEDALFVLPASLILREFGSGNSMRFDCDVTDTFPIRDFPLAFGVAIATQVRVAFTDASAPLFFSFRTSIF